MLTDESQAEMTGISMAFDNKVSARNCVWHKVLTFERSLDKKGVSIAVKAIYSMTQLECMNNLLMIMREYKQTYDDISLKLLARKEEERTSGKTSKITDKECYYWKQIVSDVTKKNSKIKTTKFKPSNAMTFLKTRIEYVYKSMLTRDRWSLYSRINDTIVDPLIIKSLQHSSDSEFTTLVPDVDKCFKESNNILDQINSSLQRCDYKEDLTIIDNDRKDYNDDDIEAAAISISSLLSTQPSETIHSSLKSASSNKIINKKNIVLFTDAICNYFVEQDRKIISKPPKSRIRRELDSMFFTSELSAYKRYPFQKEISVLFRDNYNINKVENYKLLLNYEDIFLHRACAFCIKCRLCGIPCKHVMSYLLKGIMVETGYAKKEEVYELFLEKLDKILAGKIAPAGTKRKSEHENNVKRKKKKESGGETMDRYGLTIARTNELLIWAVKKVANCVETSEVSHIEKKKALAFIVNLLTNVFNQQVPIIEYSEVNKILKAFKLSKTNNDEHGSKTNETKENGDGESSENDSENCEYERDTHSSGTDGDYASTDLESIHSFSSEDSYNDYYRGESDVLNNEETDDESDCEKMMNLVF